MTLEVFCDVVVQGDKNALEKLRSGVQKTFEASITKTGLAAQSFEVLRDSPDLCQVFFITRYEEPTLSIKNLATEYPELIFTLTFDNQIGNAGRIQFKDGKEIKLAYESEFQSDLNKLVSEGAMPSYGIIATAKDEAELYSIVIRFAENKGYEPEGEPDEDEAWAALDWLVEEVGQDFGCFEIEDLNFIFRPWDPSEM